MVPVVKFYFVHAKHVNQKPYYLIIPSANTFQQMVPGSTWKYEGQTLYGPRWQSIVIIERFNYSWVPRFNKAPDSQLRPKKLSRRGNKAWRKFMQKHCLTYLNDTRGDRNEEESSTS